MPHATVNTATYAGSQDITIYPYQNVASIDADQILLDIAKPGVYNAQVSTAIDGTDLRITIYAGTTFVFKKSYTTTEAPIYTREFIVKVVLTDDIDDITYPLTALDGMSNDSLILVAGWDWEEAYISGTNKYVGFTIQGEDGGGEDALLYSKYLAYGDLIVCELLNHAAVKGATVPPAGDGTYNYPIAYQNIYARQSDPDMVIKDYRDTFERLNNSANQFIIQFGKKIENPGAGEYYTKIYCVSGYGMIRDTAFSIDETTDGVPVPLESYPADKLGAGTYQIDILRIIVTDDVLNTPKLEWTSTSSETAPSVAISRTNPLTIKEALAVLGTQEIPFIDDGIIVGIALRTRANIGDHTTSPTANTLWPYEFVQWNPGIPFIGHSPTTTRISLPIYAESDID